MSKDKSIVKSFIAINFFLLAIIFILVFGPLLNINNTANAVITMLTAFVFMLIHGYLSWGLRNIIAYLIITWICSFTFEAIGVATGSIFGQYFYTRHLGPQILGVPIMIQISYAAMGYASIMTARLILGVKTTPHKLTMFLTTLVAAMLMVGWDVCLDPYESTVAGDWVWHNGGPYFGIGLQNFVGWFVTVFIFMFVYHLYACYYAEKTKTKLTQAFHSQPLIYYAIMALAIILVPIVGGVSPFSRPFNYPGTLKDLVYSLSLITVFVMGTPCIIALSRLLLDDPKK
jgi:uncharacterized membrane protein